METRQQPLDAQLASLPLPIRSIGAALTLTPEKLMGEGRTFGGGHCSTQYSGTSPRVECSLIRLNEMLILSGRTTPIHAWEEDTGRSSITICYAGSPRYVDGRHRLVVGPGDVLVVPRNGGRISTGYLASINVPIEHSRLRRTLLAMKADAGWPLDQPLAIQGSKPGSTRPSPGGLFEYFAFVDAMLSEHRYVAEALAMGEQIYRLFALALIQAFGASEAIQKRWASPRPNWTSAVDGLVDYIRANAHRPLSLTDLEEQSNYSARHLQTLFKEKFDCTPMQFVRRQRLSFAMERLESGDWDDTVTTIARDCGYRHTSNFSTDFQSEFGVSPSTVLRSSRPRMRPGKRTYQL